MKRLLFSVLIITLSLLINFCNTTEPKPEPEPELVLKLEDVSCTEAWLQLTTNNIQLPATINLLKNNTVSQIYVLSTQDSILYIDSLLPNQTYKFLVTMQHSSNSSNETIVTTMDTTSHNFTFTSWTFGTIGSSTLYDVAIINENNIWAVGEIMIADTSQNGYTTYNAVHWDGSEWELLRIPYIFQGDSFYNPIYAVFAFSADDIWFGIGNLIHWNGTKYIPIEISTVFPSLVKKIWGSSSNNLYVVGNEGKIAFNNGTSWSRIESGTELQFTDIYGATNTKTSEQEILAVASNYSTSWEKEILLIKNNQVQKLSSDSNPTMEPLLTTWFVPNKQYYVAGSGIYQKHLINDSLWKHNLFNITTFATTSIRGNNINDVIGVGAFGDFVHFNGVSWKNDYEEPLLSNGSYTEISVKGDLIVAVGSNQISINSEAVILVGRR